MIQEMGDTSSKRSMYQSPSATATAGKSLQLRPTLPPHRRQPTRLPRPWDSPGKNTGVGCHFLKMFNLALLGVLIRSLNHLFQHYLEAEVLPSYCFMFF